MIAWRGTCCPVSSATHSHKLHMMNMQLRIRGPHAHVWIWQLRSWNTAASIIFTALRSHSLPWWNPWHVTATSVLPKKHSWNMLWLWNLLCFIIVFERKTMIKWACGVDKRFRSLRRKVTTLSSPTPTSWMGFVDLHAFTKDTTIETVFSAIVHSVRNLCVVTVVCRADISYPPRFYPKY